MILKWTYVDASTWWVAVDEEKRTWKVTVTADGTFLLSEGGVCWGLSPTLKIAKHFAELLIRELRPLPFIGSEAMP